MKAKEQEDDKEVQDAGDPTSEKKPVPTFKF